MYILLSTWFYLHSFKRKRSAKNEMKLFSAATMKLVHFGEEQVFIITLLTLFSVDYKSVFFHLKLNRI